jgi:hypothetical protein
MAALGRQVHYPRCFRAFSLENRVSKENSSVKRVLLSLSNSELLFKCLLFPQNPLHIFSSSITRDVMISAQLERLRETTRNEASNIVQSIPFGERLRPGFFSLVARIGTLHSRCFCSIAFAHLVLIAPIPQKHYSTTYCEICQMESNSRCSILVSHVLLAHVCALSWRDNTQRINSVAFVIAPLTMSIVLIKITTRTASAP